MNDPYAHKGYIVGGIQANKVPKSMHFQERLSSYELKVMDMPENCFENAENTPHYSTVKSCPF